VILVILTVQIFWWESTTEL